MGGRKDFHLISLPEKRTTRTANYQWMKSAEIPSKTSDFAKSLKKWVAIQGSKKKTWTCKTGFALGMLSSRTGARGGKGIRNQSQKANAHRGDPQTQFEEAG